MAGLFEVIAEKIGLRGSGGSGGGDKMQYLLAGTLILVIGISLIAAFTSFGGSSSKSKGPRELHYWCLEAQKEFVIDPKTLKAEDGMMMPPGMGMPGMGLVESPYSGGKTGVLMQKCPACGEYFVAESWLNVKPGDPLPSLQYGAGDTDYVCTKCGTDIIQWYRDRRKKK